MSKSPWVEVLPLAKAILHLVREHRPEGLFDVSPAANIHIIGMFWRGLRLYDATLLLLEAQLPEEAMILSRSLFEVSLRLKQLEAEPNNRYALVLGWMNSSIDEALGLLHAGKVCGLDSDIGEAVTRLEEYRKQNSKYAAQLGVTKYQPFLSVKDAALKYDRKDYYWNYELAHESVHGSDAAWTFARQRPAEDTIGLYAKTGDPLLLSHFAHVAARSMVDAANAVAAIVNWKSKPELEQLVKQIDEATTANINKSAG